MCALLSNAERGFLQLNSYEAFKFAEAARLTAVKDNLNEKPLLKTYVRVYFIIDSLLQELHNAAHKSLLLLATPAACASELTAASADE